jgi:hypothetical protein
VFINDKIKVLKNTSPIALLDQGYRDMFFDAFTKFVMPKVRDDIYADLGTKGNSVSLTSLMNYKIGLIVEGLASDMSSYDINIVEHSSYILEKLTKRGGADKRLLEVYNSVINKLDAAIEVKKKMQRTNKQVNPQFVNSAEFTTRIDNLLFEDLYQGLESFYLYEILNDFYMDVSGAIGTGKDS